MIVGGIAFPSGFAHGLHYGFPEPDPDPRPPVRTVLPGKNADTAVDLIAEIQQKGGLPVRAVHYTVVPCRQRYLGFPFLQQHLFIAYLSLLPHNPARKQICAFPFIGMNRIRCFLIHNPENGSVIHLRLPFFPFG